MSTVYAFSIEYKRRMVASSSHRMRFGQSCDGSEHLFSIRVLSSAVRFCILSSVHIFCVFEIVFLFGYCMKNGSCFTRFNVVKFNISSQSAITQKLNCYQNPVALVKFVDLLLLFFFFIRSFVRRGCFWINLLTLHDYCRAHWSACIRQLWICVFLFW